jgi:hypothetical protein
MIELTKNTREQTGSNVIDMVDLFNKLDPIYKSVLLFVFVIAVYNPFSATYQLTNCFIVLFSCVWKSFEAMCLFCCCKKNSDDEIKDPAQSKDNA